MSTGKPSTRNRVIDDDPYVIKIKARRHRPCWSCREDASEETTVSEKLTPIMRQPDGRRHTMETLEAELNSRLDEWDETLILHGKCEKPFNRSMLQVIDQLDEEVERLRELQAALVEAREDETMRPLLERLGIKPVEEPDLPV